MRNVGELLEIENSAQFVLKGLSQLLLQPPARARKRPYRHMGSLCKMTTVVAVVFAALVGLIPGFFKKGVGGRNDNVMPLENWQNLGKTLLRLGRVVAMLQSLMGGITCKARRARSKADSESNFRATLHRSSRCPLHCHDAREAWQSVRKWNV